MAITVEQIDPLDVRPSVAVGVDLPFSGTGVFNSTFQTKDAIKANLVNYFLTNKGERYLNLQFGSDIRLLLFENINPNQLEVMKATISNELKQFFPRVKPSVFEITSAPDTNTVRVYFRYQIVNTNVEDEILINIEQ
jgi:phage baseplate assembly protein W